MSSGRSIRERVICAADTAGTDTQVSDRQRSAVMSVLITWFGCSQALVLLAPTFLKEAMEQLFSTNYRKSSVDQPRSFFRRFHAVKEIEPAISAQTVVTSRLPSG